MLVVMMLGPPRFGRRLETKFPVPHVTTGVSDVSADPKRRGSQHQRENGNRERGSRPLGDGADADSSYTRQNIKDPDQFFAAGHVLIEPLCSRVVRQRLDAIVSRFAVMIRRPGRQSGDGNQNKRRDCYLWRTKDEREHQPQYANRQAVDRQRIDEDMNVLGITQMLPENVHEKINRCQSASHLLAFLRTFAAGFRAILAMLWFVFRALGGARLADLCAQCTESGSEITAARHQPHRESADIRAVTIELDATSHFLYIRLVQTFRRAMFACYRAGNTRVDTTFVFFVWHYRSLLLVRQVRTSLGPSPSSA